MMYYVFFSHLKALRFRYRKSLVIDRFTQTIRGSISWRKLLSGGIKLKEQHHRTFIHKCPPDDQHDLNGLPCYPIEYNAIDYLCNDLAFSFLDALKYLCICFENQLKNKIKNAYIESGVRINTTHTTHQNLCSIQILYPTSR